MRDYTKAIEAIQEANDHDVDRQHTKEISQQELKCQQALFSQRGEESQEETLQRAMRDPEVAVRYKFLLVLFLLLSLIIVLNHQGIMNDPVMQQILQQAQNDSGALQDHMKNPSVRQKIQKLVNAGIIRTR